MPDPPLYTSIDPWKKHIRNIDSARALKDDRDAHNQTSLVIEHVHIQRTLHLQPGKCKNAKPRQTTGRGKHPLLRFSSLQPRH